MKKFETKNAAPRKSLVCNPKVATRQPTAKMVCAPSVQTNQPRLSVKAVTNRKQQKKFCDRTVCDGQEICGDLTVGGNATVDGLLTSNYFKVTDSLTQPFPDGPYAVDHFQVARDNVQLRSPVRWRVADVPDLEVSGVQTVTVGGVEYFGRLDTETNLPVYLTYPLPVTVDVYVPSTRTDRDTTYDFFPNEGLGSHYAGHLSLEAQLLANATSFFTTGEIQQSDDFRTIIENNMNYNPDNNSLSNLILASPLELWTGLQGIFLLDDLETDAYDRLVALKALLETGLTNNRALAAYRFLMLIAGSYGVPVDGPVENSVPAALRQQAIELVISSSNFQRFKHFKAWARRHGLVENKDTSTDQYQPDYDFENISLIDGEQARVVIMGDASSIYTLDSNASKLASWGISAVIYSATYRGDNPRTPGKWRNLQEILNSGQSFPDSTFFTLGPPSYTIGPEFQYSNYEVLDADATNVYAGMIGSIGWNYALQDSHTGTSSYEFNQDTIQTVIDMLRNAVDTDGLSLAEKLYLDAEYGVFGRSGGSNALNGAHMINKINPGTFIMGVAMDIVLTIPFWGFDGTPEDLQGGSGNLYGVDMVFPGGLNFFVMFLEPKIDWYYEFFDGSKAGRSVVGSRKSLQNLFRRTILTYRSKSMFMEYAPTGHFNIRETLWSNERGYQQISGKGIFVVDRPTFPDIHTDPVYGFQDTANNRGNIDRAMLNTYTLYYRSVLSRFEDISAAMFDLTPFKYQFAPWDIPGADDYQWPYRFWQMDLGGAFRVRTDIIPTATEVFTGSGDSDNPSTIEFEITDRSIELIQVFLEFEGQAGLITGDLDIYLMNQNGEVVTGSTGASNPEHFYFDFKDYQGDLKLGTWSVFIDYYIGANDFTLTVVYGKWKLVFDSQFNSNSTTNPEFSLNHNTINIANVPTSPVGLISGDIYSQGGFLKILE